MPLKLVVMGTGEFAVPMFRELLGSRHPVLALVTQPAHLGPGRHEAPVSRVKPLAMERGVEVLEPENINTAEGVALLRERRPDLLVVAAYGQILSDEVLAAPRLGGINLHASLLPKYRGAAPVNWAIYHGETETGVTVIEMQPRVDAGPILAQKRTAIAEEETAGELSARLAELGAPLVVAVIEALESGSARPVPQDPKLASRAPRLKKTDGAIDWSRSAVAICNQVRAMQPWPTAYTFWLRAGQEPLRLIILRARPAESRVEQRLGRSLAVPSAAPGTVLAADNERLEVQTGSDTVAIQQLQPGGKRPMSVADFLHGHPVQPGDRFGPNEASQTAANACRREPGDDHDA